MKAILVIDMPNECDGCPCLNQKLWECQADIKRRSSDERPSWCPLKPMPKESIKMPNDEEYMKHYKRGRNDVIAEIKGEMMQSFCD